MGQRNVGMVFQQGDVLPYALHALAHQFGVGGRYAAHHVLHVGIVEHGAMHDTAPRNVVKRRARNLLAVYQDIVSAACLSLNAQLLQCLRHHVEVTVEGETNVFVFRNVRKHHVAHVGIHASASAFTAEGLNVMFPTIVKVHLVFYELVSPEQHGGFHLPHEETLVEVEFSGHKFLHGQIKRDLSYLVERQFNIYHLW